MKHLLKRLTRDIPGFFIGDILHNEDDPAKHSSAKLIFFILSMMFVAVLIIAPTYILSHNWKEFIKVLIIAATVITGLFYLKYTGKIIITAHLIALTLFLTTVYNSFFADVIIEINLFPSIMVIVFALFVINGTWSVIYFALYALLYITTNFLGAQDVETVRESSNIFREIVNAVLIFGILTYFVILNYASFKKVSGKLLTSMTHERDISINFKKINEELKESEARIASLMNNSSYSILSVDDNLKLLAFNEVFQKSIKFYFDISVEIGMSLRDIFPAGHFDGWRKQHLNAAFDGTPLNFEDNLKIGDNCFSFQVCVNPIYLCDRVTSLSISTNDITRMKKIEHELVNAKNFLEQTGKIAEIGGWEVELETYKSTWTAETYRIHEMNTDLELDLDSTFKFCHPDEKEMVSAAVNKLIANGIPFNIEYRLITAKGNELWIRAIGQRQEINGTPVKIYGVFQNITSSKLQELAHKKANEELVQANTELDNFVYKASHNLRGPITSCMGLINLCELENENENIKMFLDLQRKSLNKLDNFIKDILEYSWNSRSDSTPEPIHFSSLIEDCVSNYELLDNFENINMIINIDHEQPFYSDAQRLRIIFANILSNAIKFSRSKIKSFVKVKLKTTAEKASIVIEDNGMGIDGSHLNKVFDMFYRASEEKAGAGIGLYIAKQAVDKLNGTIQISSNKKVGTKVVLEIPNWNHEICPKTSQISYFNK